MTQPRLILLVIIIREHCTIKRDRENSHTESDACQKLTTRKVKTVGQMKELTKGDAWVWADGTKCTRGAVVNSSAGEMKPSEVDKANSVY